MNAGKKVNVNYSSLVGLKTELLRKQTEVEKAKAENVIRSSPIPKSKSKTATSKNVESNTKEVKEREKSRATELDDVNDFKKSRHMLELKSQLYEKLKENPKATDTQHFLVDFSESALSSSRTNSSPTDDRINNKDCENFNSNKEDWVEYQDCFGRTRRCLRHELPKFQEEDSMIREEMKDKPPEKSEIQERPSGLEPPRREPEIERLRKKWEEQSENLSYKQDIHYQDILYDEARMHGVGYYAFSSNEEERIKQQERFFEIRKETEQRQKEKQDIKEFKLKIERNRLKAARVRQRIRAGLPPEFEETPINLTEKESLESTESVDGSLKIDGKGEENKLVIIEDKIKAFGELLGKRPKFRELSQEEWVEKKRRDRIEEFAPIYNNFRGNRLAEETAGNLIVKVDGDGEDPLRIGVDGPEPTDLWDHKNISEESTGTERELNCGDEAGKNNYPFLSSEVGAENDGVKIPTAINNLNIEKISEGLKYLRKKYDETENYEN